MKKKLITMLAICSIACCIGAGAQTVKAEAEEYDYTTAINALAEAAVRVDMTSTYYNGIRFQATVDASIYADLEKSETETRTVNYGMVVAPLDYETTYGKFTKASLFGADRIYRIDDGTAYTGTLITLGGGEVSTLQNHETDATKKILYGSLLNIANSQLTREFVGIPYICITENSEKTYYVANYNESRSMVYVAQRAIQDPNSGLTDAEKDHLNKNYINYKDDTTDIASKQYAYTVQHIALDPEGNQVEVLETTTGAETKLGETVSATQNVYENYTYKAELSTASDIIYANDRTVLKLYYEQDHVNVTLTNSSDCVITPDDENYAGKNYALKADGAYNFTITPPENFDKDTQQLRAFINGQLLFANEVEGKYSLDLSGYEKDSDITITLGLHEFKSTISAGQGNYLQHVSVTKETESDGAALYTYSNKTSGLDGDSSTNRNWGESGLFFGEVYYNGVNAADQENVFYNKGYNYIRFDVKFADNTTGYNVRVQNTTYQMEFGSAYDAKSGIVRVVNRANAITTNVYKDTWYTVYVQPTKGQQWTLWTDGGSADAPALTYIKNVQYLEELPKHNVNLVMRLNGDLPERDASLEYKVDGDFAGAWKYTNGTLGTVNGVWGEAGLFFNEIYNANSGYGAGQTFFSDGYQYIKLDFYAESTVYSISIQNAWSVGNNYVHLKAGDTLSDSSAFAIYDANGDKVNQWLPGAWYTLVIKPSTENPTLHIQTNAETTTSETPVMYVKNLSYEKAKPFAQTTLIENTTHASLEKETSGDFAGAYKYTNTSLGRGGSVSNGAGVFFNEVYDWKNGCDSSKTFFTDGFKYIKLDFYAESSVYSIDLQMAWIVDDNKWVERITAGTSFSSDYFSIYNQDGEKVNTWTAGEWYTLVIEPQQGGTWDYPLSIQTNAETAESEAPVMYIKNPTYLAEAPFAN